jgi:hypothetical protein
MSKRIPHSKRSIKRLVGNKLSRGNGRRFYTLYDMAIVKLDEAIRNSKINRGEVELKGNNHNIVQCGCGGTGCFIHFSYENKAT